MDISAVHRLLAVGNYGFGAPDHETIAKFPPSNLVCEFGYFRSSWQLAAVYYCFGTPNHEIIAKFPPSNLVCEFGYFRSSSATRCR